MNPYINPWFFYWAGVVNSVRGVMIGAGVLLVICFAVWLFASDGDVCSDRLDGDKERMAFRSWVAIGVVGASFIFVAMFIPTKEILYQMGIANSITPDSVNSGIETVKSIIDYIVQKVAEMK